MAVDEEKMKKVPYATHKGEQPADTVAVQAYRREEDSFNCSIYGTLVAFKVNAAAHVVAYIDKAKTDVIGRLVDEIPEAYCLYEGKDPADFVEVKKVLTPADTEPQAELFVLKSFNEDGTPLVVDLKALDDAALKAFAKSQEFKIPGAAKGDGLRRAICKAAGQATGEAAGAIPTAAELAAAQ